MVLCCAVVCCHVVLSYLVPFSPSAEAAVKGQVGGRPDEHVVVKPLPLPVTYTKAREEKRRSRKHERVITHSSAPIVQIAANAEWSAVSCGTCRHHDSSSVQL